MRRRRRRRLDDHTSTSRGATICTRVLAWLVKATRRGWLGERGGDSIGSNGQSTRRPQYAKTVRVL
jgi:hypothetical protein